FSLISNKDAQWIGTQNYGSIIGLEIKTLSNPSQDAAQVLDHGYAELTRVSTYVIGASDPDFWISLKVTALFALISLPLGIVISLCYALLLNTKVPGIRIFRTLIYSPVVVPGVVTAILFLHLLAKDEGWINQTLRLIGITGPDWLNRTEWILPA